MSIAMCLRPEARLQEARLLASRVLWRLAWSWSPHVSPTAPRPRRLDFVAAVCAPSKWAALEARFTWPLISRFVQPTAGRRPCSSTLADRCQPLTYHRAAERFLPSADASPLWRSLFLGYLKQTTLCVIECVASRVFTRDVPSAQMYISSSSQYRTRGGRSTLTWR